MFNYALSVFVAFLFYGVIFNILQKVQPDWYDTDLNGGFGWFVVGVCACLWFISLPVSLLILILFVLKLLTDKISDLILNHVEKRKLKKTTEEI
jgi:uncharacterized membrane protein required for colicin V production